VTVGVLLVLISASRVTTLLRDLVVVDSAIFHGNDGVVVLDRGLRGHERIIHVGSRGLRLALGGGLGYQDVLVHHQPLVHIVFVFFVSGSAVAAKKFDVLVQACAQVVLLLQLAIVATLVYLRHGLVSRINGTGTVELLLLALEIHRAVIVWAAGLLQGRVGNLWRR